MRSVTNAKLVCLSARTCVFRWRSWERQTDDKGTCRLLFSFPWLLQSLFSTYIHRRLFSPETVVSPHKIVQFYCVRGGWNLAIL